MARACDRADPREVSVLSVYERLMKLKDEWLSIVATQSLLIIEGCISIRLKI